MSLAGEGIVAIWNGIRPEGRAEFFEWHTREHMLERVAIPGFRRGRRYIALEGNPEFFTLYETESTAVLTGTQYLARLNSPTPWTRRATAAFTDTSRSLCRVALSLGPGEGGLVMAWRFDSPPGEHFEAQFARVLEKPGICGIHLGVADRAGSGIETEEKKGRPVTVPGWVVMVEGSAERAALEAACRELRLPPGAERGLYQLQYTVR